VCPYVERRRVLDVVAQLSGIHRLDLLTGPFRTDGVSLRDLLNDAVPSERILSAPLRQVNEFVAAGHMDRVEVGVDVDAADMVAVPVLL